MKTRVLHFATLHATASLIRSQGVLFKMRSLSANDQLLLTLQSTRALSTKQLLTNHGIVLGFTCAT